MASKISSARRAGGAPPLAENYLRPDMRNPRKDVSKKDVSKKKGGTSSSGPAMPARPPPLAFVLFMCDFRKSEESESVVKKAAEDKWNSMSEAEKRPYEKKALETAAAYDRAAEFYKTMMNAPKAMAPAAPPTGEKLSEAATTGGPME